MISKLADEGLVVHEPYAGISLTEKGQKYAAELVRSIVYGKHFYG